MLKIPFVHQVLYMSFFIFQVAISSKLRLFNKEVLSNLHSIKYLFEDDVNVACNQLWYLLSFSGLYGVVALLILAKILGGEPTLEEIQSYHQFQRWGVPILEQVLA